MNKLEVLEKINKLNKGVVLIVDTKNGDFSFRFEGHVTAIVLQGLLAQALHDVCAGKINTLKTKKGK